MGKKKINSVKVEYNGIEFDSLTERDFYIYLTENMDKLGICQIRPHPQYKLIEPFELTCPACKGEGTQKSEKTGRDINCKRCKGSKVMKRQGTSYTADFQVLYSDGGSTTFDVKGFKNDRFPLYKKLFEHKYGIQLVEVYRKQGEWIYK